MAILTRLREFLDHNGVEYTYHAHPPAYTAREVAAVEHIPPHDMAKVVVFLADDAYGMAVLPADAVVDVEHLRRALGASRLRLATEGELSDLFPGSQLGAMPPMGNLFNLPVYVDASFPGDRIIGFNAGTHRETVYLKYQDFERLVKPMVLDFARTLSSR